MLTVPSDSALPVEWVARVEPRGIGKAAGRRDSATPGAPSPSGRLEIADSHNSPLPGVADSASPMPGVADSASPLPRFADSASSHLLEIAASAACPPLFVASNDRAQVVFAGTLDNAGDIARTTPGVARSTLGVARTPGVARTTPGAGSESFASHRTRHDASRPDPGRVPGGDSLNPARLILSLWEQAGERVIDRLRGQFVLLVADYEQRRVLAFRDHLGLFPLFWAEDGSGRVLLSPSVDSLLAQPGVSRSLRREVLADYILCRCPDKEETCFTAIRRVPRGNVLVVADGVRRLERHWHAGIRDGWIDWLPVEAIDGFDPLFRQAVERSCGGHTAGISLSGGLDSISVAAVAAELAGENGTARPLALSLVFPGDSNEEDIQRAVATELAFEHVLVPILEAAPDGRILGTSLEMGAKRSSPLLSPWCSAYFTLARRAVERGFSVILTGIGGDEWLTVSPYWAADLLRSGNIVNALRMAAANHRSFNVPAHVPLRTLFRFGVRPLASAALDRLFPDAWRRNRLRRLLAKTPPWLAPDPELRRLLAERAADSMMNLRPRQGFYAQDILNGLDFSLVSWELEESFETARQAGTNYRHPFLDADLTEFLTRTRPEVLNRGGRTKGLVREATSRRFPGLGLDRQKKVTGTSFYNEMLRREGPVEWKRMGGPTTLAALGVVDLDPLDRDAEKIFQNASSPECHRLWDIMSVESWARSRT